MRFCLLVGLILSFCIGCSSPPSEESLSNDFRKNRPSLEKLVSMLEADDALLRITSDSVTVRTQSRGSPIGDDAARAVGIGDERLRAYRDLLQKASIQTVAKTAEGAVLFYVATGGIAVSGWVAGYAYSRTELKPVVKSLAEVPSRGFVYKKVENGWYMMKASV